nr:ABC transporter substrate-binding protein [Bifidobacterium catenulatum]
MSRKNMRLAFATIATIALAVPLAACGTSDASSNSDGSMKENTSIRPTDISSVKKDDKIAAMLPKAITEDGKLIIGMDTSYAPAEFLAEDGKTAMGFDVDLAKAMGNVFGLETEALTSNFDSIIPSVGSKYDLGISSFTITKERSKAVDFVSYLNNGNAYIVRKGNPTDVDIKHLCGKTVAVQSGTTQEDSVKKVSEQCKTNAKDAVDILSYKRMTDMTTAVVTGKADASYSGVAGNGYAVRLSDGRLEITGGNIDGALEGIVIHKGDTQTAKAVQAAVQKLIDDGTYMKILKNWGSDVGAVKTAEINPEGV